MGQVLSLYGQTHIERQAGKVRPRLVVYRVQKRFLDILGAAFLILAFLPLFALIALLVKATSRGSVFYVSKRVGLGGKVFNFYKFRSMYIDADKRRAELEANNEKDGPIFKMKKDPRITPLGRFLRKFSLDELPQIFSVLNGDMSLVGPRPPLVQEVERYSDFELERLAIRPGLTCYWQIMGRSDLSFEEWMRLDHRYMREMSFWNDLAILVKTPAAVAAGKGAY
jgi:lipopolysaccharide/colanic/teichoic acid biosynthesis glycosyltransferase